MTVFTKTSKWLKIGMILVALAVVLVAGWTVWKQIKGDPAVNSYKTCADAGNPIQLSYPSVCVTKDGKRFVNPDERLN